MGVWAQAEQARQRENEPAKERERARARGKREDRKGNRSKTRERVLQTPPEAGDRPNP